MVTSGTGIGTGDGSPGGRIGVMVPRDLPAGQVLPFARRAEELGFDEVWVVEDLGFRGGVAQAGAVLAATGRVTVGIGIMPAGARNAAYAAMELGTLGQLFPGRVTAGIGHGMPEWMRQAGAWPESPLTLLREYTVAVRTLLRGRPGPENGRYVQVQGVVIGEVPEPGAVPPVVLGVRGPKSQAVAGKLAEGVLLAEPAPPAYVTASLAAMGDEPDSADRPRQVITYDVAAVDDDEAVALDRVRPGLAWIGEPDWAAHIAPLPFADDFARLRERCATREEFAAALPKEWLGELSLAGTPSSVRARLHERFRAGATTAVLTPVGADPLQALEELARVLRAA
ncbi:LLM class flavin-dependent oxidoreductase [Streptomyces sp. UC4497]